MRRQEPSVQVLELPQPFLWCNLPLSDSSQCYPAQFYGREVSILEAGYGIETLHVLYRFSQQNADHCDKKEIKVWVNLWRLEVKLQHMVTCLVQEVCLWMHVYWYHHHLGRVFCPLCRLQNLFSIQLWQNMNDSPIEDKKPIQRQTLLVYLKVEE